MAKGIPTNPETKNKILKAIHDEGMTAYAASKTFGISEWTINGWIKKDITNSNSTKNYIAKINQLQKKLDNAYRVIGELTAETPRPKG